MSRVKRLITIDKNIQFGTPVFSGTRTPIFTLFEFMKGGWSLDYYLENFPAVSRKQAEEAIAIAEKFLTSNKLALLYETLTRRKRPKTVQIKSKKSSRIKR